MLHFQSTSSIYALPDPQFPPIISTSSNDMLPIKVVSQLHSISRLQGSIFNIFWGEVPEICPAKNFRDLFLVAVVDQMILGSVSCLAKKHCNAVFALRNGEFSKLNHPLNTPWSFVPGHQIREYQAILFSIRENQLKEEDFPRNQGKSGKFCVCYCFISEP